MDARNKIFTVVGTVAILGTAGVVGVLLFTQQDVQTTDTTTQNTSTSTNSTNNTDTSGSASDTSTTTTSGNYKDGTYTATKTYSVPHGETNSIQVSVVISSGKISSVTTNNGYTDHESGRYIDSFENSVSDVVVGQSIGSTSYSRIAGASLTSVAFYDALDTIASQAKA